MSKREMEEKQSEKEHSAKQRRSMVMAAVQLNGGVSQSVSKHRGLNTVKKASGGFCLDSSVDLSFYCYNRAIVKTFIIVTYTCHRKLRVCVLFLIVRTILPCVTRTWDTEIEMHLLLTQG